jgi:hypothetical protein
MLLVKSFIEIAKRMTPNIFLIIPIPFSPIIFSILLEPLRTIYKKHVYNNSNNYIGITVSSF